MIKPRVVVAEAISDAGLAVLRDSCDVEIALDVEDLGALLPGAAALIVRSATTVDRALIEVGTDLQVIGRAGIGVDNIDLDAATEHGVLVVNAPNANTVSAAEHTIALFLAQARNIPEADASLRAGRWERKRFSGVELHGKTLAVLGLGHIGALVAQRATAFGMRVLAYDPYVGSERARRLGAEPATLEEALSEADFVTVHLPRTAETEGMIDAAALASMRRGVRIFNVARGGIVDEEALVAAIKDGHVAGAGIDVFATEPEVDSPLFALPQVVVTPHLGASTLEAQDKAGLAVAEAVLGALNGELVLSAVNLDLGASVSDEVRPFLPLAERLGSVFVGFSKGLPDELTVCASGRLADDPVRPLVLAVLKGAMHLVTDEVVSYVNAPAIAKSRGMTVVEVAQREIDVYQATVRLSGVVNGKERVIAGTVTARKGPVLIEVDGYEIEVPLEGHILLVRNDDVPGAIGAVGTYLGNVGVNITDMVVGRSPDGAASMMGLRLDRGLDDDAIEGLLALESVLAARYLDLT